MIHMQCVCICDTHGNLSIYTKNQASVLISSVLTHLLRLPPFYIYISNIDLPNSERPRYYCSQHVTDYSILAISLQSASATDTQLRGCQLH